MAGGEWGLQEDQGFTGGLLGYSGGKSERDAGRFGAAITSELIPGPWIQALSYAAGDVGCEDHHRDCSFCFPEEACLWSFGG